MIIDLLAEYYFGSFPKILMNKIMLAVDSYSGVSI